MASQRLSASALRAVLRTTLRVASTGALIIGVLGLLGWILDLPALRQLRPGMAVMKANTAISLLAAGLALLLLASGRAPRALGRLGAGLAVVAVLVGGLTGAEYLFGWDLRIDELLFRDDVARRLGSLTPGRMAPATAMCLLLVGCSLLLLHLQHRVCLFAAQLGGMVVLLSALLALMGYLYGVDSLYRLGPFASIALHTSVALLLLGLGVLLARPDVGLMRRVVAQDPGGFLLRHMLPLAIVIPMLLGALRMWGERAGLYGLPFGTALLVLATMLIFAGLLWWTAGRLSSLDAARLHEEARLRLFVESAPAAVALLDRDMRYCLYSRRWLSDYGLGDRNLVGLTHYEIFPNLPTRWREVHQRCLAGAVEKCEEDHFVRPDGQSAWLRWELRPVYDAAGSVAGMFIYSEVITERKLIAEALRQREAELRLITDNAPVFLARCDRERHYRFVNVPYAARFGMSPAEIIGKSIPDILGQSAFERIQPQIELVLSGQRVEMEIELPLKHAGLRVVHCAYVPEYDDSGNVSGYLAAILDVTEHRRAEARVAEMAAERLRLIQELQDADRRKDDFLAMLAHELRNPLAALRSAVQILKLPAIDEDDAQRARAIMERQLHHLVRLVDDLLDVNRILRNKIELRHERLDLAQVVARAVETAQPSIEAAGQALTIAFPSAPIYIEGDVVRLAQAVSNLLINAAKYTDHAGCIRIVVERSEHSAVLRVQDTGIGITAELLPHIFEPFVQADHSLARSRGGLGIGLTLVKRLVELHGGTVLARSAGLGQGSEFELRLPALPSEPVASSTASETAPRPLGGLSRRVLVVDDNVDAADSIAMLLRLTGHQVETAYDGPTALATALRYRPEIVLLDIGLPGLDGYQVARALRAQPSQDGMILAAVTGYGQEEDLRRSREAGFDAHLTKPLSTEQLLSFVAAARTHVGLAS